MNPVKDPFFENTVKLPPRKEIEAQLEKWKRRALAFQEGYKDKSFEVTALEIQLLDLRAYGVDKVTARQNESLRTKLLAACIERNELRQALDTVLQCFRNGAVPHKDIIDGAEAVLESLNPRRGRATTGGVSKSE